MVKCAFAKAPFTVGGWDSGCAHNLTPCHESQDCSPKENILPISVRVCCETVCDYSAGTMIEVDDTLSLYRDVLHS